MEATGYSRWFERLLAELGFEVWIGDPAEIKAKRVKKQKTDRQDAQLLLKLMMEDRFPQIWVPSPENRDVRQLLWHRHRLVRGNDEHPDNCEKRGGLNPASLVVTGRPTDKPLPGMSSPGTSNVRLPELIAS
jgi:transposase